MTIIKDKPSILSRNSRPSHNSDLFTFCPQSLGDTPTLTSVLEKQASDPTISQRVFAIHPPPDYNHSSQYSNSNIVPTVETTYADFQCFVRATAFKWYNLLRPFQSDELNSHTNTSNDNPVIAVLSDTGTSLCIAIMAVLKLNATAFLLSPAVKSSLNH